MAPACSAFWTRSFVFEAGQRNDLYLGILLADGVRRGDSIRIRHDHIHQHHIGPYLGGELDSGLTVSGLAHQFQVVVDL